MNKSNVDAAISDLQSQIDSMQPDDNRAEAIKKLTQDIQRIRLSGSDPQLSDIDERINASIVDFQISHPKISVLLGELVGKLSAMGI